MNKRSVGLALTVLILLFLTTVAAFAKPSADTSADMSADTSANRAVASCEVDFNATLEWEWTTSDILPDFNQVTMTPMVMDMNDDGSADILFITHLDKDLHQNAHLRVVNGHDGSDIFTISDEQYQLHGGSQLAVGDIDLDGKPEILAISELDELIAFEHDGTFKWRSDPILKSDPNLSDLFLAQAAPSIADLDQDGTPEIVVGHHAFDNQGNVLWEGEKGRGDHRWGPLSMVLDLDLDGSPEVLAGNSAYRANGDLYWHYNPAADGFTSIGNLDDDANPEIVLITYGKIRALEHDGTLKWDLVEFPGIGSGGAPAVGDVDGDGQVEIGVANNEYYMLYEADGTLKWKNSITSDKSGVESSSLFDFDGDGAPEILYSDQLNLYIFNGSDGAILWQTQSTSRGGYEYPVVADVDNDGRAEIIMSSNNKVEPAIGGNHGIQVYSHESWPSTREVWNQYSYHINNVNDDGSIPQNESNSWQEHNTYHLNPADRCSEPPAVMCERADYNAELEWEWTTSNTLPDSKQVMMTPMVMDITGDGISDVVFITHEGKPMDQDGHLRAINGSDGSEIFTVTDSAYDLYGTSQVALGDVDNDGLPEIFAISESDELLAFEHDGTFKWRSIGIDTDDANKKVLAAAPAIADLDQDGTPEIIVGSYVFNHDGTLRWKGKHSRGDYRDGPLSMVLDLDLDGKPEVLAGNTAYRADGTVHWQNYHMVDGFNSVGNFDNDPYPEIVFITFAGIRMFEHDGSVKWGPIDPPGDGAGGAPAVADVDGDGQAEIGIANKNYFMVYEGDGTLKWQKTINDSSSGTVSASMFDFEGDGAAEIIVRDQEKIYILQGDNGAVLWETENPSRTVYEYPVVADVDGDGHAELIVPSNNFKAPGGKNGIQVYGHETWAGTRQIWNQYSYHISNVNDDGTIPQYESDSWRGHNTYHLNWSDCDGEPPTPPPPPPPPLPKCEDINYNASLEWEWTTSDILPEYDQVTMTPAVMDMNGDGSADILFITHLDKDLHQNAHLRVVNGHDGSDIFTISDEQYQLHGGSQLAVGDIDLDGKPEILAISELDELIAFEHDGTFKWRSTPMVEDNPDLSVDQAAPSIADLDQDGTPEIVVGHYAFDNAGNVLWIGEKGRGDHRWGPLSMVLDLDLDGSPEVLAGNSAYRANGDLYWHYNPAADGFTSIGNLDDDANPEILLITYGKIRALEHDGTLKWDIVEFPGIGSGGAPAVGDVDGDGQVEIGVANNEYYMLYEADGTLKWKNSITSDKSGVESSSLFDFDGDGALEILYSDQLNLYIFNGSDGAILWQTQSTSRGGYEYPVIADVDNDGRAEIVVSSNNKVEPAIGGNHGIQVYGHDSWPSTRSVWNQYSYHINNVNDDGSIPQYESNSWQDHNTYHLNPSACWAMCEMVDYQADLKWQWTDSDTLPDSIQVAMTPAVMDITGDGVPDVLFITHTDKDMHANGHLRAIDGADGREIFTIADSDYNVHGGSQVAVGDIDLDGQPEIFAISQTEQLLAFEHDGTFKWRSSVIDKKVLQAAPAIADIDADGTPEIIVGAHVFNNDGTLRWEGSESRGDQYDGPLSMVVDLDMDGTPELLAGNMAYRSDGTVYWKNNTVVDGFNGLGNFDEDAYPEVLLVTYGKVRMLEHDGTLKWGPIFLPGNGSGGAPAVADVDGDGQPEMAIANQEYLMVLEGDGSIKWQKPMIDNIGVASASMFDFDNDGIAEIIYSGQQKLSILRGSDGSTLWETSSSSRGSYQYPLVVDVDGDGHVEIVMSSNNRVEPGRNGIQVYGHESWPSTRKVWNQYTYHITNVNSDGSIPQHERNSWEVHNTYHLNPTNCGIDLAVTKENDVEFVYQGDTIHYTITVESLSAVDATGVVVSDTLPANTSFVSASHGGTESGGTVTWNLGEMLADSRITLNLTIRVNDSVPADGRTLTNRISVTDDGSNGPDQNPDDNRDEHIDYVDTSEPPICTGTFPDKQIINGDFDGGISIYPADVDGDGDQDILGAGQYANDITWWENDGNGTFTEHTIDGDFDGAFSVYADDVDEDGDVDVLGAAFGANEVAWWANNGDGTWTKHVIGSSDRGAYSVRTADVDGDGDQDALGAWINNRITWWANNGDGTSWTEYEIDTDFGGAQAVEVADLDADGDIDVLGAARYGNDITWWENSGDGSSWTEHLVDGEFRYAVSVEAVDMDRDGDLDLLGSATDDDDITWWENDGNAAGWAEHVVDGEFDGASWAMAIDMDYDGDLDVLGAGRDNGEVAWWQNRGGDAILWSKHLVDDQFQGSHSVYAVDLDGNYALDIVAAAYIEDDVAWWRNDCEYAPDLAVTKDDGLSFVHPGQVITYTIRVDNHSVRDGTGVVLSDTLPADTTFVSASHGGSETSGIVTWNLGTLSGHSSMTRTLTIQVNDPLPVDLTTITNTVSVADDGANGPDPVPGNNSDTDVDQVDHTPQFCEVSFPDKHIIDPDFDGAWDVFAADIDGDGDMDALSAAAEADDITWWENSDGAGLTWTKHTIDSYFNKASSVYAVDMDNDGDIDVFGSAELDHDLTWWENDGTPRNGGWTEHTVEGGFNGAHDIYPADINGDGFLDVLGAAAYHDQITWLKNDGTPSNGGWVTQHLNTSFDGAYSVYAEDVDGDSDLDILGAAKEGDKLTWWENTAGDGSAWTEQVIDDTVDGAHEIHAADLDGDGDIDLLSAASEDDDITWWENSAGDGSTWTERTVEGNFDGASSVYAIDLDLDGDLDIVAAAQTGHLVGWWENFGNGLYWNSYLVDTDFVGAWSIYGADVDGDTDFDIMGAAFDADEVAWWENKCIDAPELSVSKDDGVTLVRWGDVITYTITGSNAPGQDASGVVMTDLLPDYVTFIEASDGGTHNDGTVTWAVGDLPANSSITRTLTVQLDSPIPLDVEYITNTVTINDDGIHGPDPKLDNNSDTDVDEVEHPGHIKGNLRLVGRDNGDTPYYNGATINVIDSNGVVIASTTSDANGDFELNNVPTGPNTPYTIRAEMELFLYAERNVDVLENQTSTMPFLPLWPGDSNGDGKVNIVDLTALTTLLNDGADIYGGIQCANGTSWNPATEALPKQLDFNGNCIVDITDIGLHSGTIAAFFSGTNGSVGEDMPVVQTTPGSPAEAGTPWQ